MAFLPALAGGLLGIGSSIIGANAQKAAAAQQAAQQQALEQAAFSQQVQYNNAAQAAQRQAFTGLAAQGNPYLQAISKVTPPQALAGGSFGGGSYGPGGTSNQPGMAGGAPQGQAAQGPRITPAMQQAFTGAPQPGMYPARVA